MILLRMLAFSRELNNIADQVGGNGPMAKTTPRQEPAVAKPAATPSNPEQDSEDWRSLIESLRLSGPARELAVNCVFKGRDGNVLRLILSPAVRHLHRPKVEALLEEAVRSRWGADLRLNITVADPGRAATPAQAQAREQAERLEQARLAIEQDPNVRALKDAFGAQIVAGSIRPR